LLGPLSVAVNVADWPPVREAVEGVTETDTEGAAGTNDIAALALLVASAALVAFTVMVCAEGMVAGAV
jgi:hypothetical protein